MARGGFRTNATQRSGPLSGNGRRSAMSKTVLSPSGGATVSRDVSPGEGEGTGFSSVVQGGIFWFWVCVICVCFDLAVFLKGGGWAERGVSRRGVDAWATLPSAPAAAAVAVAWRSRPPNAHARAPLGGVADARRPVPPQLSDAPAAMGGGKGMVTTKCATTDAVACRVRQGEEVAGRVAASRRRVPSSQRGPPRDRRIHRSR